MKNPYLMSGVSVVAMGVFLWVWLRHKQIIFKDRLSQQDLRAALGLALGSYFSLGTVAILFLLPVRPG
jgi:hypothetical protein